jgi:hypothetical protein
LFLPNVCFGEFFKNQNAAIAFLFVSNVRPDPDISRDFDFDNGADGVVLGCSLAYKKDATEPEKADQASPILFCSVHSMCRQIKLKFKFVFAKTPFWRILQKSKYVDCLSFCVKCKA